MLIRFLFTLILCSWLIGSTAHGQSPASPRTLAQLTDTLRRVMEQQRIPGLMLVLTTRDSVLFAGGLGLADVDKKEAVSSAHLFRMGSVTKLFTALGILQLVQAGKLRLDDPVRNLAPELPIDNPWEATNPVRVIHLLEHTAGFGDKLPGQSANLDPVDERGLAAIQRFASSLRVRWKPGERHSYANPGYNVAAYLIEKVSGMPWDSYVDQRVLRPLGMATSSVALREQPGKRYAQGYYWQGNSFRKAAFVPLYQGGNGSLQASAADLANCLQAYLRDWKGDKGNAFLSAELLRQTERVHTTLASRAGLLQGYGLGNASWEGANGVLFQGHTGSIGAFMASLGYNRQLGIGYACAINVHQNLYPIERLIQAFLTQAASDSTVAARPIDPQVVSPYVGYYRFASPKNLVTGFLESLQHSFRLQQQGDTLIERELLGGRFPLVATGPTTFRGAWNHHPTVALVTDSDGNRAIMEGGLYYQQVSWAGAWMPIILLLISLALLLSGLIAGPIWLIQGIRGRFQGAGWSYPAWGYRLLPVVGSGVFLAALYRLFTQYDRHTIVGSSATADSWFIFSSLWVFALCFGVASYLLVQHWPKPAGKWLKGYFVLLLLTGGYLIGLLAINGWLSPSLWAL
ncbi:serine hydrolase domain-containing protein [Spirosoma oryzicola]|uniref:serine hydrolase domain-containing protein n=1 Tax=Spirosoma oryzicola TaxID=2898794 RepID=UPI001E392777|nr:serine hydrolase domain-containing protein [Spirosoma oryzicola]UHG94733.1 beta-lactamase family protein [Spirosoma oryzicola]